MWVEVKGEGKRGEDGEQTAPLSRRSTTGCESEKKQKRGKERSKLRKGQCVERKAFLIIKKKIKEAKKKSNNTQRCCSQKWSFNVPFWTGSSAENSG